jgi:hypothetical protein
LELAQMDLAQLDRQGQRDRRALLEKLDLQDRKGNQEHQYLFKVSLPT